MNLPYLKVVMLLLHLGVKNTLGVLPNGAV